MTSAFLYKKTGRAKGTPLARPAAYISAGYFLLLYWLAEDWLPVLLQL